MVSTRFSSFLLILILLPLKFSSGHPKQVKNSVIVARATSGSRTATSNMHAEICDGVPVVAEIDERMMLGQMTTKELSKEIKSDEHWNTEAYHEVQGKKGNLNVKRKSGTRGGDSVRVKMPGFVSLNADYHVPRPHPPKNN